METRPEILEEAERLYKIAEYKIRWNPETYLRKYWVKVATHVIKERLKAQIEILRPYGFKSLICELEQQLEDIND